MIPPKIHRRLTGLSAAESAIACERAAKERRKALQRQLMRQYEARAMGSDVGRVAAASLYSQRVLRPHLTPAERIVMRRYRSMEISVSGVCRLLQISRYRLDRLVLEGKLAVFRRGSIGWSRRYRRGGRLFLREDVERVREELATLASRYSG